MSDYVPSSAPILEKAPPPLSQIFGAKDFESILLSDVLGAAGASHGGSVTPDPRCPGVRTTMEYINGLRRIAVRDLVQAMLGRDRNYASQIVRRFSPETWLELQEFCVEAQFKGVGERMQPMISLEGAFVLMMHLPGARGAEFRRKAANLLLRVAAGDEALIAAMRAKAKFRDLFSEMAREEVAAAAGAGAPVDDAENLQLQRRTQLRLEHADAVMKDAAALTTVTDAVRAKAAADVAAAEAVRVKAAADADAVRAKAAADAEAVRAKAAADVDALQQVGAADSRIRKQRDEDAMEAHVKRMREADETRLKKLQEADDVNAKDLQQANALIAAKAREEAIKARGIARELLLKRAETIAGYYAVLPDTPDRQQRVDAYVALLEQQACWEPPPPPPPPQAPPPQAAREQIPGGAFLLRDFVRDYKLLGGLRGDARALVLRDAGRNLTEACIGRGLPVFRMGGESNHYPMAAAQLAFDIIAALVRAAHGQPDIGGFFFTQPSQPSPPQPDDAERAPAGAGASA